MNVTENWDHIISLLAFFNAFKRVVKNLMEARRVNEVSSRSHHKQFFLVKLTWNPLYNSRME